MSDLPSSPTDAAIEASTVDKDELRTMSFRMREIQRLLSMRVEQENRRLEAEGLDPVRRPRFLKDADATEPHERE